MEKHQIDTLLPIFNSFSKVSLLEIEMFSLLKRYDSKFLLTMSQFYFILQQINSEYSILFTNNSFYTDYSTLYFDTVHYHFYHQHHNQKNNRYKVRFREYLNSNLSFLEIKQKSKNGLSTKKRLSGTFDGQEFTDVQSNFIQQNISEISSKNLSPVLENQFSRITLVSKVSKERLTFDLNLSFIGFQQSIKSSELVVAELKQENKNTNSLFLETLKKQGIRAENFSKYCIGLALLNNSIKKNNFKSTLQKIQEWNF